MSDETFRVEVSGRELVAAKGEPLLMVLLRNGYWALREESGAARGPVCNMGVCQECRVTVDGEGAVLACMRPVDRDLTIGIES